jgi:hypothetical protein
LALTEVVVAEELLAPAEMVVTLLTPVVLALESIQRVEQGFCQVVMVVMVEPIIPLVHLQVMVETQTTSVEVVEVV